MLKTKLNLNELSQKIYSNLDASFHWFKHYSSTPEDVMDFTAER